MEQKIKSISEAFSMQPKHLEVDKERYNEESIKEIKKERVQCYLPDGEASELMYVGYNFEGQIIFQYLNLTVNVHYFYE